jgi:acetyl-CoA carboxylase carboxyltransferase component
MREKQHETYAESLSPLEELRFEAIHADSEPAVARQHERGKYTGRERIEKLLNPGSIPRRSSLPPGHLEISWPTRTRCGSSSRSRTWD